MASNGELLLAVESGSYRAESDDRLRELLAGALEIHGSNPAALHRINQAAEILRKELAAREAIRREQAEEDRQRRLEQRLNELKRPHWTVTPNFWFTVLAAVAALVSAYFAMRPRHAPGLPGAAPPHAAPAN